jgi:hypothetical protein
MKCVKTRKKIQSKKEMKEGENKKIRWGVSFY